MNPDTFCVATTTDPMNDHPILVNVTGVGIFPARMNGDLLMGTTSCPGFMSTTTQSTTTIAVEVSNSPVDNPVLNLFLGIMIMYVVAAGVISFFRKR